MSKKKKIKIIQDYDHQDTTAMIDPRNNLRLKDIGIDLPEQSPSQVVSLRLPTPMLNELRALGSQRDVPYQALIKVMVSEGINRYKRRLG